MKYFQHKSFTLRVGRWSENNRLLSFMGSDGLNQRSKGYWHRVWWIGPLFFSVKHDEDRPHSACDCWKHERQVCDICQNATHTQGEG